MAFDLKSGNSTPFKMMGSSPLKQSYPSSSKTGPHGPRGTLDEVKKISKKMPSSFNMTKLKDLWWKQSKELLKKAGGKTLGIVPMMIATSSKADQPPPPPVKPMDEKEKKSVQIAISQQMNPLKK